MKNTRKTLPIVTFLLIILLSFGCRSRDNTQRIYSLSKLVPNAEHITTEAKASLSTPWYSKLFTKENLNALISTVTKAASGDYVGAVSSLFLAATTVGYALKDKKKGNLLNEVREESLKNGLDIITNLTNTKKQNKKENKDG